MGGCKPVILCVDDEKNPLTLRKMVLERAGYEVLTASSAEEAMQLLAQGNHVDVVVSDYLMPGVVGTELAKRIKKSYPELPFVLLSGVNDIPDDASCADLFISKVEGPSVMCTKIAAILASQLPAAD